MTLNSQVIFLRRPHGALQDKDFELRRTPIPSPSEGEVLTRTLYLSVDPANRAWMQGRTYKDPVPVGGVMEGFTLGRVLESCHPGFAPGDLVEGMGGWQQYALLPGAQLCKLEPRTPLSHWMSVLGVTGKTAYFGLLDIGRPKKGETVLVSAAAGATGSVAAQIAKLKGCRVVGVAGTSDKCRWLTDELALDGAINYREQDVGEQLRAHCPEGIDVYFDNVGGEILQQALYQMRTHGRIVCCGSISSYNQTQPPRGPFGVPSLLVTKRLRMQGFVVMDMYDRRREAEQQLARWVDDGKLVVREEIVEGLDNALSSLKDLFTGANRGKRMVRLSPEE